MRIELHGGLAANNIMRERDGNLITLAKEGHFDVITHGCNCFCTMGAGIAVPMKENFGCDVFPKEHPEYQGDMNKLGTIDYQSGLIINNEFVNFLSPMHPSKIDGHTLTVVNSYTQYRYGKNHIDGDKSPVDYNAIALCMKKINHTFKGKTIGLPLIGCGLAGGDWLKVRHIIQTELKAMDVWIVHYKK